ncbi:hypothetical protein [Sphingomonas radiodurans]|uniref:hypothetical protein n=1 Tax=Sphingomonas radiodurans TaxID=2890321 RepID=UPI001E347783|nr:hypothetical protein [Sphingomonas radiodurans]WBH15705.1 hypothetical protein LLW23_12870 [Sphingomonas radiodurans]
MMRLTMIMLAACATVTTAAQAQTADSMSRRIEPNAIDRSIARTPLPAPDLGTQAEADRTRADQAARDASARRGVPSSSTITDGPAGVQRLGSGIAVPAPTAPQL